MKVRNTMSNHDLNEIIASKLTLLVFIIVGCVALAVILFAFLGESG